METGLVSAGVGFSIGLSFALCVVWLMTRRLFEGDDDDAAELDHADRASAVDDFRLRRH